MTKKAYFHVDLETTSLGLKDAPIRELGISITDWRLLNLASVNLSIPVHPNLWDKDTLNWAARTYGSDFVLEMSRGEDKDWRKIWLAIANEFTEAVKTMESYDYEVWLVANHTDFDVAMLKVLYEKLSRPFPVKYNRVLDMPSLMVGFTAAKGLAKTPNDIYRDMGKAKSAVAHTALADAMDQVESLTRLGICLPE